MAAFMIWGGAVAAAVGGGWAAVPPARAPITALPGWKGALPSKMANGWIDVGLPPSGSGTMYFHYFFIESENDPANDPLLLWYQGGPGASSLFGLFVELGPLMLNEDSLGDVYKQTGVPQLVRNPGSWSGRANLLVVDNPPPVGFSYCEPAGPAANGTSCGDWNDALVATANHKFLVGWLKAFPEHAKAPIFLSGESYAGVYVPTIAREVVNAPSGINLAGFAVGDGCMGTEVLCGSGHGPYYDLQFMWGHGQFSNSLYRSIMSVCSEDELKGGKMGEECQQLVGQVDGEVGNYYPYNLYDTCSHDGPFTASERTSWGLKKVGLLGGAENDYACPGNVLNEWLNRSDVRAALHVSMDANFFSGDNGVGFNYNVSEPNLLPFYREAVLHTPLRVMVYNGDTDPGINSLVTQDKYFEYFNSNGVDLVKKWRPWTLDGEKGSFAAGAVTTYEGNFTFVTIRGSGHMVPEFKPQAASVMINAFISGETLPH